MSSVNRHGINYRPFDALEGFKDAIKRKENEFLKNKRPILSEDQKEAINEKIVDAIRLHKLVTIKYHKNGYNTFHCGYIKNITDVIVFDDRFSIFKNDVIDVE